jgi:hypothetical protein
MPVTAAGLWGVVLGHASEAHMSPRRHNVQVSLRSLRGTLIGAGPTSVTSLHQCAVQQTGEHQPVI